MENLIAPDEQEHGNCHRSNAVHQRRTDGLDAHVAQIGAEQPASGRLEAQNLPQFGIEGLHDAIAGDGLMQDVLNLRKLILAGACTRPHFAADFARGCDDDGNEQHQRPAKLSAQANNEDQAHNKGEKLLQEFADHGTERGLHAVHIVDQCRENCSGGMLVKEAGGPAHRDFVKMIAKIGNCAEAGIVDQVSPEIIAEALGQRGDHKCKCHHTPGIMHVHEMGNQGPKVEVPSAVGKSKGNRPLGRVGP